MIARALLVFALGAMAAVAQEKAAKPGAVDRALGWLVPRLAGDGALAAESANAAGKLATARCLVSWILELSPEDESFGAARNELRKRVRDAARGGGGGAALAFTSWVAGFAGPALYERAEREDRAALLLRALVHGFARRQNAEGGWGHGGGFEPEFYPTTLIAATNLGLLALGMGRRHGIRAAEEELDAALELVTDVQGPGGGMPYGGRPYRKGFESGRTAGTVVALAAAGETGESFRSAAAYLARNLERVPHGHASPAVHVLLGAIACRLLGGDTWRRYQASVLATVRAAQRADGAFDDILGLSPDTMGMMGGRDLNTAYVTAFYAAALAVPRSRWVATLAEGAARVPVEEPAERPRPHPVVLWSKDVSAPAVAIVGGRVCWIEDVPEGTRVSSADAVKGDAISTFLLPATVGRRRLLLAEDGRLYVLALPVPDESASTASALEADREHGETPSGPGRLLAADLVERELSWSAEVPGDSGVVLSAGDELFVRRSLGDVVVLSAEAGRRRRSIRRSGLGLNGAVAPLASGEVVYARGSRLWRLDAEGAERWTRRTRRARGVRRSAFSAAATLGDLVLTGTTGGVLAFREASTGAKARPSISLGASIERIVTSEGHPDLALVVTADHRVQMLRDGERVWSYDPSRGLEGRDTPRAALGREVVWAGSGPGGELVGFDLAGRVLGRLPLPAGAAWAADERSVVVAADGRLAVHRLP